MPTLPETKPVEDSVAKIDNEFAVGADPEFQTKWERFERITWIVLIVVLALSFAGVFGRGPLAQAHLRAPDGSMDISYERIQRFGTPSVLTIDFPASSLQHDAIQLWANDCLVKPLGTQRVVPQPLRSVLSGGGILYTFPANSVPLSIEFQTQPSALGLSNLKLQMPGKALVAMRIFVMP